MVRSSSSSSASSSGERVVIQPRQIHGRSSTFATYFFSALTGLPFYSCCRRKYRGRPHQMRSLDSENLLQPKSQGSSRRAGPRTSVSPDKKTKRTLKFMRLFLFAFFVIVYILSLIRANDAKKTAPVAEQVRILLFPEAEETLEDMIQQQFAKSFTEFMPGPDVAQALNSLQSKCLSSAMQPADSLSAEFVCDIIKIEFSGMRKSPFSHIPCESQRFMEAVVKEGDLEPYDELPSLLKHIYKQNRVPAAQQFTPQYVIGQGYPFFAPLFNTEEDKQSLKLGPLPKLNMKLNAIARKIGIPTSKGIFSDNPWDFEQASGIPRKPADGKKIRNVEKNHHWDVAFMCEPKEFVVSFKVRTLRSPVPLWWRFRLSWTATGTHLNYFHTTFHIKTGLSYNEYRSLSMVVPLVALAIFSICFLVPSLIALVCFPYNLFRLYAKKGTFKRNVSALIDPLFCRTAFNPAFNVFAENVGSVFSLIGFCLSMRTIFSANSLAAFYDEDIGKTVSPYTFWAHNLQLSSFQLTLQVLYGLWCDGAWHALALAAFMIRLLEFSLIFDGTSFVLMTFLFAFFPVLHFSAIFLLLLMSFALILFSVYGRIFTQYCTLPRCLWSILLYTFSFGDASGAEYMINPFIEQTAVSLQLVLLAFQVIVVIIFLNMFTTIVIDAYNVACDRASSPVKMKRLQAAMWYRAKRSFGYKHELDEEIEILGGVPGAIFFRATVLDDEDPLQIRKDKPDPYEIAKMLGQALDSLKDVQPQLRLLQPEQRRLDSMFQSPDLGANTGFQGNRHPVVLEEEENEGSSA